MISHTHCYAAVMHDLNDEDCRRQYGAMSKHPRLQWYIISNPRTPNITESKGQG